MMAAGSISVPAAYAEDQVAPNLDTVKEEPLALGTCNYSLYNGAYELRVYSVSCTGSAQVRAMMKYYVSDNTTRVSDGSGAWVGTGGVSTAHRPSTSFEHSRGIERRN